MPYKAGILLGRINPVVEHIDLMKGDGFLKGYAEVAGPKGYGWRKLLADKFKYRDSQKALD